MTVCTGEGKFLKGDIVTGVLIGTAYQWTKLLLNLIAALVLIADVEYG